MQENGTNYVLKPNNIILSEQLDAFLDIRNVIIYVYNNELMLKK